MKFPMSFIPFAVVSALMFVACGDDSTSINSNSFPEEVANKAELNTYESNFSAMGVLIYVESLGKNYECDGDEWFESYDQPKSSAKGKSSSSSKDKSSSSNGKSSSSSGKSSSSSSSSVVYSSSSVLAVSTLYEPPCKNDSTDNCEYGLLFDERDGQSYKTVKIGKMWWMAENLNYAYLQPTESLDSSSFCYDGEASNCEKYGRLYLWSAVMDSAAIFSEKSAGCGYGVECEGHFRAQGICPAGWYVPSYGDWYTLFNIVGGSGTAGNVLVSAEWRSDSIKTDAYGFGALPAGITTCSGSCYSSKGSKAYFWNSSEHDRYSLESSYIDIRNESVITVINESKDYGLSVRCVMNDSLLQGSSSSVRPKSSSSKTNVSSSSSSRPLAYVDFHLTSPKETYFNPEIKYDSTIDTRDGKVYRTITIAPEGTDYSKTWMAENLDFDVGQGGSGENKYNWSWCFHYEEKNCEVAGRLYTWTATIDSVKLATDAKNPVDCGHVRECGFTGAVQGICPSGWHLPDTTEWNALFTAVGGRATAAKILKTQTGWYNNGSGTDDFGFSALPAGYTRVIDEDFNYSALGGFFWTSTELNIYYAYYIRLNYDSDEAKLEYIGKDDAYSVRCVKDKE